MSLRRHSASRLALLLILVVRLLFNGNASAQSTATLQGTILDATGAAISNATVTARNQSTGEERITQSDSTGNYVVASVPVGVYRVEVKSPGMQTVAVSDLPLEVGRTVRQDFSLKIASTTEVIEVSGSAEVIEQSAVSVGSIVDQRTVQEIPLNGRHFVDLALLIPGTVTPPANGFLTAPLRGQGSFAFNTAGSREDSINFMINGINLSDPVQNQITFQPTINTVQEFKVDNSTYSAEYGRNSGAIVNIATRSGSNEWHGELYDFLRNNDLDARNFTNPKGVPQAPFKRNQFGGDGGGYIRRDKTFFYLSYEGLRQRQAVPLSTTVLSDAQRAQVQATSDATVKSLLPLIPQANSPGNVFVSSAVANVNIDQGTANVSHDFNPSHRVNVYYAFQQDLRGEPPTTDGNNLPGYGDTRQGRRQILTFNDVKVIKANTVNEFRLGYNRIHITFVANDHHNPADFGINAGVGNGIGLPQITVTGAFAFGSAGNLPQGRGDYSAAASDTLSWIHGNHAFKFGGEYRRINNNNFTLTPGTYTFASIATFMADQVNGFTSNPSNRSNRIYVNSIGGFALDSWKVRPNVTLELGLRYDWFGTPTEAAGRFVIFDAAADRLVQLGSNGAPSAPYNQSALNFQPRVGLSWDVFESGKTVVRSAYAIMTDQPITGIVTALATNPPFALPLSVAASASLPTLTFANSFTLASGTVSPNTVAHDYKDAYVQSYNFNVQQQLAGDLGVMAGYFGSKGTDLNIERNYNQLINGGKPYQTLSANSPIFPGRGLGPTIIAQESGGNSTYNALWVTAAKRFAKGLQFNTSYTFSKSIDYNSRNNQGIVIQDSYNIRGDRGLSDFDARHRWVLSGIYDLPFKGNRLVAGWQFSSIVQLQTGNPILFRTTNTALTGIASQRYSVNGPVKTGFAPSTDGNATRVTYIQNPTVFFSPGNTTFGNLGRNVIIGPGFANIDFALVKNTKITERFTWEIRADAFDLFNHPSFTQPISTSAAPSGTFGLVTGGTRFPAGDSGSSRQIQLAMKLIF